MFNSFFKDFASASDDFTQRSYSNLKHIAIPKVELVCKCFHNKNLSGTLGRFFKDQQKLKPYLSWGGPSPGSELELSTNFWPIKLLKIPLSPTKTHQSSPGKI